MNIYLCDIRKLHIAEQYDRLLAGLSVEEQNNITRFRMEAGRHLALARELLLRHILREAFGGKEIVLGKNAYGKPVIQEISGGDGCFRVRESGKEDVCVDGGKPNAADDGRATGCPDFDFSISHSGDIVAIGFGNGKIGIDVERNGRAKDYESLLRFFSGEERKWISDAADPEDEFYRVWTFREAFSKEEGIGLSLFEKERIAIDYLTGRVIFRGRKLRFYEYDVCPGYRLSACVTAEEMRPRLRPVTLEEIMMPRR